MTKKEIRKSGYSGIFKEGKSHQECFDELKDKNKNNLEELANELSKIPSNGKTKDTIILRNSFIVALLILILLRVVGIVIIGIEGNINTPILVSIVLLGIALPIYGIYGAIYGKTEAYYTTGIFLAISLLRGFGKGEINLEIESLVAIAPILYAIVMAYLIPYKYKTPYKKVLQKTETDGKGKSIIDYQFEDTRTSNEDILDMNI